ncbi:MAG: Ig-like domain-containing protein [Polaribacter sp.]|nr:Ig-like domain-containing protein [Polaribacter sp.]
MKNNGTLLKAVIFGVFFLNILSTEAAISNVRNSNKHNKLNKTFLTSFVPKAQDINTATKKNTVSSIYLVATNSDIGNLNYTIVAQPINGSLSLTNDIVVYTPDTDFTGVDTFTYQVNDGSTTSNTATVSINVFDSYLNTARQIGQDIDGVASGDESGTSIAMSADGKIVAIGATKNDGNGSDSGHVRVYSYSGNNWSQLGQDLNGEATNDWSGTSLAISEDGTTLAIGASFNDNQNGTNSGHVRIYSYDGNNWLQLGQDINGEAKGDQFGYSVSLSGDGKNVVIGTPMNNENGSNSGHVRVYSFNGNNWSQLGQDLNGEARDWSGYSVSLATNGKTVAIGAIYGSNGGACKNLLL